MEADRILTLGILGFWRMRKKADELEAFGLREQEKLKGRSKVGDLEEGKGSWPQVTYNY